MVGRQDFESEEWQLLCQAPTYAGLVVSGAHPQQTCPGGLHDFGLVPALQRLAETFSERSGIETSGDGGTTVAARVAITPSLRDSPYAQD